MTNDVENVSITNNKLSNKTAKIVIEKGLPRILDLYYKFDVESTFYFTGQIASNFPQALKTVVDHGHEIGCHGFSHKPSHSFDVLSFKDQYIHLEKAKRVLEYSGQSVEAFRAPALRLGLGTVPILEKLGFKTDSSVASQRFDGPLTFGSLQKLRWLTSPRLPYNPSRKNPYVAGKSKILEIPTSSLLFAYQGTTMRVAPELNRLIGNVLYKESRNNSKPIVFLSHPNEFITEKSDSIINRRSKSFIGYLFGDVLRRKLKLKNLGKAAIELKKEVLKKSVDEGFEFISAKSFRKKWRTTN